MVSLSRSAGEQVPTFDLYGHRAGERLPKE